MSAEIKAKVFDADTLVTLEKVYQYVQEFTLLDIEWEKFDGSIRLMMHNVEDGLRSLGKFKQDKERPAKLQEAP
jgi:hypothetical protein